MSTPMELNEAFADALAKGKMNWCRAKLFRALAGAAKQGVLDEVLGELFDDDTPERVKQALVNTGWLASSVHDAAPPAERDVVYQLVCKNNGCVCGTEKTLVDAEIAARTQGCGYCDGHLRIERVAP